MKTLGAVRCALAIVVAMVMAQGGGRVLKLEELTYTEFVKPDYKRLTPFTERAADVDAWLKAREARK